MKQAFRPIIMLSVLLMTVMLAACGSEDEADSSKNSVPVAVQLSWVHNVEFVGFYDAIREGFYEDNGLDVRLIEGGFDASGAFIDPIAPVLNGEAMFGVTGADVLLKARAEGVPIVAVAAIYQRSPVLLISLGDSGITNPSRLEGNCVSTQPINTTVGLAYEALLRSQDIDRSTIDEIMRTDFTTNPLFDGEADVLAGFITTEGVQVRESDPEANFILMSDYGIDIYSNVIFTTETTIANNPDIVLKFLRATVRGIRHAVDNPNGATEYFVKTYCDDYTDEEKAIQPASMALSLPLLNPAGSQPGMMVAEVWDYSHQLMLELGLLDAPLDVEAAYDLSFLESIYSTS